MIDRARDLERIVGARFLVENENVLVLFERLFLGIGEVRWMLLVPYPLVAKPRRVAHHQGTGEGLAGRQDDRRTRLGDPLVLLP